MTGLQQDQQDVCDSKQTDEDIMNQVYAFAINLLFEEKQEKYVVTDTLIQNGIDPESAKNIVDNLISTYNERVKKNILYGALWCVGGLVATIADFVLGCHCIWRNTIFQRTNQSSLILFSNMQFSKKNRFSDSFFMNKGIYYFLLSLVLVLFSCESKKERQKRTAYDKYINNSLETGDTPYSYLYGVNQSCSSYGCSAIKVRTPRNSDVLVIIKKDAQVVSHAYIKAGNSYIFELSDGSYQAFFYYGKGWDPEKVMKQTHKGTLKGGFISDEHFGKDDSHSLSNQILEYELILQRNGNFRTRPSNANEAL